MSKKLNNVELKRYIESYITMKYLASFKYLKTTIKNYKKIRIFYSKSLESFSITNREIHQRYYIDFIDNKCNIYRPDLKPMTKSELFFITSVFDNIVENFKYSDFLPTTKSHNNHIIKCYQRQGCGIFDNFKPYQLRLNKSMF